MVAHQFPAIIISIVHIGNNDPVPAHAADSHISAVVLYVRRNSAQDLALLDPTHFDITLWDLTLWDLTLLDLTLFVLTHADLPTRIHEMETFVFIHSTTHCVQTTHKV